MLQTGIPNFSPSSSSTNSKSTFQEFCQEGTQAVTDAWNTNSCSKIGERDPLKMLPYYHGASLPRVAACSTAGKGRAPTCFNDWFSLGYQLAFLSLLHLCQVVYFRGLQFIQH